MKFHDTTKIFAFRLSSVEILCGFSFEFVLMCRDGVKCNVNIVVCIGPGVLIVECDDLIPQTKIEQLQMK